MTEVRQLRRQGERLGAKRPRNARLALKLVESAQRQWQRRPPKDYDKAWETLSRQLNMGCGPYIFVGYVVHDDNDKALLMDDNDVVVGELLPGDSFFYPDLLKQKPQIGDDVTFSEEEV